MKERRAAPHSLACPKTLLCQWRFTRALLRGEPPALDSDRRGKELIKFLSRHLPHSLAHRARPHQSRPSGCGSHLTIVYRKYA